MIRPTFLRLAEAARSSSTFTVHNNPYKAQKEWPPDFSKLPHKYQFSLERRYKRRSKLKWARPKWVRGVKLTSYIACGVTFVYGVLFMDWDREFGTGDKPFQGVRDAFWGSIDSIWTSSSKPEVHHTQTPKTDTT